MPEPDFASWGSFQPGASPTVPASPSAQGGDPVVNMIQGMVTPISQADVTAAVTPIAGAHTGTVPSTFQRQIQPFQERPMNTAPVVGAGNARARGIGNTITGVTNAIGKFVNNQQRAKQDLLKDQATKVIQAQQTIDESQQTLDMAKQSGDTATVEKMTQLIEQNKQTRDAIFAGKHGKDLAKGFDFSYVDPEANKTEYHAAVQDAIKDAKTAQEKKAAVQQLKDKMATQRGQNAGEAFAKAQPQGLAANTQAQAKVQMAMAQQKIQQTALKDYLTFKAAMAGHQATVTAASVRAIGAGILQQANFSHQQDMMNQRFAQAEKMQGERFGQEVKMVWIRAAAAQKTAHAIWEDRQANPLTIYQKTQTAYREFSQNMVKDSETLTALQNQRLGMYKDTKGNALKPAPQDVQALDQQIMLVKQQLQADRQTSDNLRDQANRMSTTFGLDAGSIGDGNSTSEFNSTDQSDAAGSELDWSDPLTYNLDGSEEDQ